MKNETITLSVTYFLAVSAKSTVTGALSIVSPLADGTIESDAISENWEVLSKLWLHVKLCVESSSLRSQCFENHSIWLWIMNLGLGLYRVEPGYLNPLSFSLSLFCEFGLGSNQNQIQIELGS